jgi:DtxR family Mn-dependent transcriptional regulator
LEKRIFELLGRPELDPHGHAIPTLGGKVRSLSERPLSECRVGEKVVVQGVSDDDPARLRELKRRGLLPGTRVEIVVASTYEAPIEVRIKGRRVSIPLGLARAMFVEAARTA